MIEEVIKVEVIEEVTKAVVIEAAIMEAVAGLVEIEADEVVDLEVAVVNSTIFSKYFKFLFCFYFFIKKKRIW